MQYLSIPPAKITIQSLITLLLLSFSQFSTAKVTASVDRTEMAQYDYLYLTLSSDQRGNSSAPDLSGLNNNFDVVGQSQSSNISIINGQRSSTREWRFQLSPKRSGTLTIPEIAVGGEKSQAITINVLSASEAAARQKQSSTTSTNASNSEDVLILEVSVDKRSVYVQQEIILKVTISHRIPLYGLAFEYAGANDAIEESLGDGVQYQRIINGKQYGVYEQKYVVYPLNAGQLTIPQLGVIAEVADTSRTRNVPRQRSLLDQLMGPGRNTPTKNIRRVHEPLIVTVKPIPPEFPKGQPWLPASKVELSDDWDTKNLSFILGDPITRNFSFEVLGQHPNFIPDLKPSTIDGLKAYSDTAKTERAPQPNNLLGRKFESHTLIPTKNGQFTLPAKEIYWWNVNIDQLRKTVIPARTLSITGASATNQDPSSTNNGTTPETQVTSIRPEMEKNEGKTSLTSAIPSDSEIESPNESKAEVHQTQFNLKTLTLYILLIITCVAVILSFLFYRKLRKLQAASSTDSTIDTQHPSKQLTNKSLQKCRTLLTQACDNNDHSEIKEGLIRWASAALEQDHRLSLDGIKRAFDDKDLSSAISSLEQALYAPTSQASEQTPDKSVGQQIKIAVTQIKLPKANSSRLVRPKSSPLKSLYGR